MPMQIVFPISMVAVGVTGAAALMVVGNHLLFHKTYRPVMTDEFDDQLITRDAWVRRQNAIRKKMRENLNS